MPIYVHTCSFVSSKMMNVHFWFHALSEIPDILVWLKNGENIEVSCAQAVR